MATDADIVDWLQRQHTLHRQVSMLYVVDGYDVAIEHDGEPLPGRTWHGRTLREALTAAMADWDVTHGGRDLLAAQEAAR